MKVFRQETPAGVLEKVIFQADGDDFATFKAAVKTWETTNGIVADWEQFFDQVESIDLETITLVAP